MSKALIQVERKAASTNKEIELTVNRSLFSELNEYARFAKIPGRTLKEKREKLVIAMIEKILADDKAFTEHKAAQKKDKAALKADSKKNTKALKKELIAENELAATIAEEEVQTQKN